MTDNQLLELSRHLQNDADEIVNKLDLLTIANKYCECYQIGSSMTGLLVDEDIDFTCYVENVIDIDNCLAFAKELLTIPTVEILRIKNYLTKDPYYQFKVYVDPYHYKDRDWQIAFSFQVKTADLYRNEVEFIDWVNDRLDDQKRLLILRLKRLLRDHKIKLSGTKVYQAVLEAGIKDYDELLKYLGK